MPFYLLRKEEDPSPAERALKVVDGRVTGPGIVVAPGPEAGFTPINQPLPAESAGQEPRLKISAHLPGVKPDVISSLRNRELPAAVGRADGLRCYAVVEAIFRSIGRSDR